ncbi:MAG: polysaccharide deacetylase family protein [bacterium]
MNAIHKIKYRTKRFVVPILFRCGYYSWLLRKRGRDNRCLILMYHRIGNQEAEGGHRNSQDGGISRWNFEKQMQFLSEHMTPVSLPFLVKSLNARLLIPPRSVVVTFDDGYADNYLNAYPILKKYRIPATIFLATGYISTGRRFWWDQLRAMIRQNPKLPWVLEKNGLLPPKFYRTWFSADPCGHPEMVESLISYIWRRQNMCPDEWVDLLGREFDSHPPTDDYAPLTWEQVQEMSRHNLDFGSHTVSHPNMVHLSSQKVEEELGVSKNTIEHYLGRPVEGFAYPIGRREHYDTRIKALVRKVGFQYACTAQLGCIYPEKWDVFSLNRIPPPDSLPYFVRDLSHYLTLPVP